MKRSIGKFAALAVMTLAAVVVAVVALPSKPSTAHSLGSHIDRAKLAALCTAGGEILISVVIYEFPPATPTIKWTGFVSVQNAFTGGILRNTPLEPNPQITDFSDPSVVSGVTTVLLSCDDLGVSRLLVVATTNFQVPPNEVPPTCVRRSREELFGVKGIKGSKPTGNLILGCHLIVQTCRGKSEGQESFACDGEDLVDFQYTEEWIGLEVSPGP